MKIVLLLFITLILSACNKSGDTSVTSSAAASSTAPYLWHDENFPKTLLISSSFSSAESGNITDMSTAWKTALEDKVTFITHGTSTTPEKSNTINSLDDMLDSVMGVYRTTSWPDSLPGYALAVTQIYGVRYNTGESDEFVDIRHADILVNYDFFDFYNGESKDPNNFYENDAFDLKTVLLHEMGHFLGLQHKSGNTVMVPSVGTSTKSRIPTSIDKTDMANKYGIAVSSSQKVASKTSSALVLAPEAKKFVKKTTGQNLKILIELMANGECVHLENGIEIQRHSLKLKN